MKLSVIIPCLNAAATIGVQLQALSEQRTQYTWEVIVSDNGSSDESMAVVERYRARLPQLRIVDSSDVKGRAHARNIAAQAASGDALVFCDADDEVAPGWLAAMGDALSIHDFVACRCDFQELNPAWTQPMFKDHGQLNGLSKAWFSPYLAHAGGGTLGIKKSVHHAVGGFDESFLVQEDTDYCFRVQSKGIPLKFVPDAVLHVRSRETLSGLFSQARVWAQYTVLIYKMHRVPEQTKNRSWKVWMKRWRDLLYSLPQIRSKTGRALWVWNVGWQLGQFIGSLRYHVPPV